MFAFRQLSTKLLNSLSVILPFNLALGSILLLLLNTHFLMPDTLIPRSKNLPANLFRPRLFLASKTKRYSNGLVVRTTSQMAVVKPSSRDGQSALAWPSLSIGLMRWTISRNKLVCVFYCNAHYKVVGVTWSVTVNLSRMC